MADTLFDLIKSLDKTEKGYFKKFANRYGEKTEGNEYLKLFDLLDKMPEYNEQKLKEALPSKNGKKINLSAQKNYLYHQILKSLRSYTSGKSQLYSMCESILDIQNLIDKNLISQAMDCIFKAKEFANKHESFDTLYAVLCIEESLMQRNIGMFSNAQILKVKEEIIHALQKLNQETELSQLLFKVKMLYDEGNNRAMQDKSIVEETSKLMTNKLLQNPETLSRKGKLMAYASLHFYSALKGNDKDVLLYMKLRHNIFEEIELDVRNTNGYLANISNIILALLNLGEIEDAGNYITHLKQQSFRDRQLEDYRKRILAKNTLMYLMVKSLENITEQEVTEVEKLYVDRKPESRGDNNLMSTYYLAVLFYCVNNKEQCLEWLEQAVRHTNTNLKNVQAYCRLLMAFVYFDLKQISLAESTLRAVEYFMKKENIVSPFLKETIAVSKKILLLSEAETQANSILLAHDKIEELYGKHFEQEATYYHDFNLLLWCKSKLNNSSYALELQQNKLLTTT